MNRNAHMVCNFNCFIEREGLLKVTDSHIHCKCGNIWKQCKLETFLLQTSNSKWRVAAYQIVAIPMTLSDFQGHSVTASLFKLDYSYLYAAIDSMSTGIAFHVVALR